MQGAWCGRRCRPVGPPRLELEYSFTHSFEDHVVRLAVHTSKTPVAELMRVAWRTAGWICGQLMANSRLEVTSSPA